MVFEAKNDGRSLIKMISLPSKVKEENEKLSEGKSKWLDKRRDALSFLYCLPMFDKCISDLFLMLPTIAILVCFIIIKHLKSFTKAAQKSSKMSLQKCVSWPFLSYKSCTGIVFTTLSVLSFSCGLVQGLEITSLDVPPHHISGVPVVLLCHYNLEDDVLYSVKWYRGNQEFFRFEPKAQSPMQIFDVRGVFVDTSLSDKNKVTLRSVTRESSGKYKCEVSADEPSFHTVSKTAEMLVVDLPKSVPNITGGRTRYHVGDEVHVNCTSGKSRPAASLMWYINQKQAKNEELVEYAPIQDDDGLETSRLGLKFYVGAKDFPDKVLRIRCTATIAAVYWQSSEEAVEGQLPQTSPALESKGVYTGVTAGVNFSVWLLLSSNMFLVSISRILSSR